MSENSSIEWTHHTFNPVRGCTKISPGCANCYAAREAKRFPGIRGVWGDAGTRIVAVPDAWKEPLRWDRKARDAGRRMRVFCASLADVFEDWKGILRFPADFSPDGWLPAWWDGKQMVREFTKPAMKNGWRLARMDDLRAELFQLIEATPHLDWQLLTKRPENVMRMVPEGWRQSFPSNVWIGTTVEDQTRADQRIPDLLKIPAKVRFLSCEPLLGPVHLERTAYLTAMSKSGEYPFSGVPRQSRTSVLHGIHWIIAGGESGPQARPMHPDWARALRDQCATAGVPFFFKQWGEFREVDDGKMGLSHTLVTTEEHAAAVLADVSNPHWIDDAGNHYSELADLPDDVACRLLDRVGKKAAGRLLDGVEHSAFPEGGAA